MFPDFARSPRLPTLRHRGGSLNPGRYVGVAEQVPDDFDFTDRFTELNEELAVLNAEAHQLEDRIAENVAKILEDRV